MVRRHHRVQAEGDLSGRDVGLIGERQEKVHGYENPMWECVDRMVEGDYPTTNLGTVAAASKHAGGHPHMHEYKHGGHARHHKKPEHEQRHYTHGEHERMRENMTNYEHAKTGGHMKHGGHKKHHYASGGHVPGSTPMKVHGHHPHHMREMEVMEPSHRDTGAAMKKGGHAHKKHEGHKKHHHYAAGGVGKVRKDMY